MKAAKGIAVGALSVAIAFNTIEIWADPEGAWWFTARSVAAVVFTVAAVTWGMLWMLKRRNA